MGKRGYDPGDVGTVEEIAAGRLTPRQQRFIVGIVSGLPGHLAVEEAGYDCESEFGQRDLAYHLRRHPVIAAEISRHFKESAQRAGFTAERNLVDIDRLSAKAEAERDFHAALRGRELIGKTLGQFEASEAKPTTQVFVLVAPPQVESPEKWAELVQQQAHAIAPPPGAA